MKTLADNNKTKTKNVTTVKNKNIDKSDSEVKSESGIESTSPDMSLDTYIFAESDDSTMDSIDPAIIEKDWTMLNENSFVENSLQYTDMLSVNSSVFETGE